MARSGTDKLTRLLCPPTLVPAPAGPHASAAHNASKPVSAPRMTLARLPRVSGDAAGDPHRPAFAHRTVQELVWPMRSENRRVGTERGSTAGPSWQPYPSQKNRTPN